MPTFDEWLEAGIYAGYCTAPTCVTHEGFDDVDPGFLDSNGNLLRDHDEPCYFVTLLIPMTGEPPA